jgi:hypothetical protein
MWQVEDHVFPGLATRVPTICVFLSAPFQERVSYVTVYMLLLQDATITEQNMKIGILQLSTMAKPERS